MNAKRSGGIIKSLWDSVAFRLTLNYGLLATLSTLALTAFIYLQTVGTLHGQLHSTTTSRINYLTNIYEDGGKDAVIQAINELVAQSLDINREVYLYLDSNRKKLAGNIDKVPEVAVINTALPEVMVQREGVDLMVRMHTKLLEDDSLIIVGRELDEIRSIQDLIKRATLAAIIISFVLVGLGTYIFRKELELRVGLIRNTVREITAGQFRQRIPVVGSNDEFSNLSTDINAMLDRVDTLMKGVRHVTDTVAHNLRTPFTRILGRLRTAQRPDATSEEQLEAIQMATTEIESLTALFDKLLQIAEIESGAQRRNFEAVDISAIVRDVVDLYQPLAEESNIELMFHESQPRRVLGDSDLLATAIANVVDNAVKYATSKVSVSIDITGFNATRIVVQDDGPGISPDEVNNIGQYFYRLDPDRPGYGLGLTSVKAIVRLHNGHISFANANPGLILGLTL